MTKLFRISNFIIRHFYFNSIIVVCNLIIVCSLMLGTGHFYLLVSSIQYLKSQVGKILNTSWPSALNFQNDNPFLIFN